MIDKVLNLLPNKEVTDNLINSKFWYQQCQDILNKKIYTIEGFG